MHAYQEAVIPAGVPVFGLTAGLPVTLQGLVGASREGIRTGEFRVLSTLQGAG